MTDQSRNSTQVRDTYLLENDLWHGHNTIEHLSRAIEDLYHYKYSTRENNEMLMETIIALIEVIGERVGRAADVSDELVSRHRQCQHHLAESLAKIRELEQEQSNAARAQEDRCHAFG